MKRYLLKLLTLFLLASYLFSGCGAQGGEVPTSAEPAAENGPTMTQARIVDGALTDALVLAADDVYLLPLQQTGADGSLSDIPVYLDGVLRDRSVLQDGMTVEVAYGGDVLVTWPAQFGGVQAIYAYSLGTEKNPMGSCYDLCGLYLQVLEDLWTRDDGLNADADYISVDLSGAPGGLTQAEKAAIAYIFARDHGASALMLTYDELLGQGYLTKSGEGEAYFWEDGVLLKITGSGESGESSTYSLPVIGFAAEKWRSPLGAYYFTDCTAVWPENGTWDSYNIGGEAIS